MIKHSFSDKLRSLMFPNETQKQFGDRIGLNRNTIAQYLSEKNEKPASSDVIKLICEKCNVSADWLVGLSDVKQTDTDLSGVCKYTGLSADAIEAITSKKNDIKDILEILLTCEHGTSILKTIGYYLTQDFSTPYAFPLNPEIDDSSIPVAMVTFKQKDGTGFFMGKDLLPYALLMKLVNECENLKKELEG